MYITTVQYNKNTFLFNPGSHQEQLRTFYELINNEQYQKIEDVEIRKLFIDFLKKTKTIDNNIEYIICQLDVLDDIITLEKIFGNYQFGEENDNKIYSELNYNVRKGLMKCFYGFEVTDFFLEDMYNEEMFIKSRDPKYQSSFDNFEIYSVAFFDTNALDVISEKVKSSNKRL